MFPIVSRAWEWNGDFFRVRPKSERGDRYQALLWRIRGHRPPLGASVTRHPHGDHDRCCHQRMRRDQACEAFLKDYYVVFTSDCSATFSEAAHDSTAAISISSSKKLTSEHIMGRWPGAEARMRVA